MQNLKFLFDQVALPVCNKREIAVPKSVINIYVYQFSFSNCEENKSSVSCCIKVDELELNTCVFISCQQNRMYGHDINKSDYVFEELKITLNFGIAY
jgi:hypothetical protein